MPATPVCRLACVWGRHGRWPEPGAATALECISTPGLHHVPLLASPRRGARFSERTLDGAKADDEAVRLCRLVCQPTEGGGKPGPPEIRPQLKALNRSARICKLEFNPLRLQQRPLCRRRGRAAAGVACTAPSRGETRTFQNTAGPCWLCCCKTLLALPARLRRVVNGSHPF